MLKQDLQRLLEGEPDHSLATLEADIWVAVDRHTRARRLFKVVLAAQTVVLAVALMGSAAAGFRLAPAYGPGELDVFSPRPSLAASTVLVDRQP